MHDSSTASGTHLTGPYLSPLLACVADCWQTIMDVHSCGAAFPTPAIYLQSHYCACRAVSKQAAAICGGLLRACCVAVWLEPVVSCYTLIKTVRCTLCCLICVPAELPPSEPLPSAVDCYERAVSLCGLSKSWGLPGLRLGWVACQGQQLLQDVLALKVTAWYLKCAFAALCNASSSSGRAAAAAPDLAVAGCAVSLR
jgi:hypothetical protein